MIATANALQRLAARVFGLATRGDVEALAEAFSEQLQQLQMPGWTLLSGGTGAEQAPPESIREIQREALVGWMRDPLLAQAVNIKRVFVLGPGISFTAEEPEIEKALREFWVDPGNRMQFAQVEWFESLAVCGELCLRFYEGQDGRVQVRLVPALEIQDVITDPDDRHVLRAVWRRYTYRVFDEQSRTWREEQRDELIPGEEVLFVAINKPPGWVRGVSPLYRALPWSKAYREWLEDRARINKAKGAWAWIRRVKGGPQALAGAAAKLAAEIGGRLRSTPGETNSMPPPKPGSVINASEGVDWEVINAKIGADDAREDGRALRLMVAAATNVFEHYLLGDPSTGNLATAKSMELPMRREFEWWQGLMAWILRQVFRRVLEAQVRAGRLPETYTVTRQVYRDGRVVEVKEEKPTVDCFIDINFPALKTEDLLDMVKAAQLEQQMGIKSDATIASELGVEDWEAEKARILREQEERLVRERERMSQQYPPFPSEPPAEDEEGEADQPSEGGGGREQRG
ncbi:MAG: phage portal protein [Bacillota bacterium]